MVNRLQLPAFVFIGLLIGTILAMQIRSEPLISGGEPAEEIRLKNRMLAVFTEEHRTLSAEITAAQQKRKQLEESYEKNTSKKQQELLKNLREKASYNEVAGPGITITIEDGYSLGGDFLQVPVLRDLVNSLFLQGAHALMINGHRVTALTPIRAAFDTIFIGNHQLASPFTIVAIGNPESLEYGTASLARRKLKVRIQKHDSVGIDSVESLPTILYTSLLPSKDI